MDDGTAYPYRVSLLNTGGVGRKVLLCHTLMGAWWLLGHYRCTGCTVALEQYDKVIGRYAYIKSMKFTEDYV